MPDRDDEHPISYRDTGVDIDEGARAVEAIRDAVRSTYRREVVGDIGGFGGLFSAAAFKSMADPIMVSGTDGVGTKLKIAQLLDKHDTVGIDLVAMCANDIVVTGAEPLFFLDYVATGRVDSARMEAIVTGIARAAGRPDARWSAGRWPSIRARWSETTTTCRASVSAWSTGPR